MRINLETRRNEGDDFIALKVWPSEFDDDNYNVRANFNGVQIYAEGICLERANKIFAALPDLTDIQLLDIIKEIPRND